MIDFENELLRAHEHVARKRKLGLVKLVEYVISQPSYIRDAIVEDGCLTWPEQQRVRMEIDAINARKTKRAEQEARRQSESAARWDSEQRATERRHETIRAAIVEARLTGRAAFVAAATDINHKLLDPMLTREEREASRQLRRSEVYSSEAMTILGCGRTELDRWVLDGRLPVFRRRTLTYPHRVEGVRTFQPQELDRHKEYVEKWRMQDRIAADFQRRGLRSVAG